MAIRAVIFDLDGTITQPFFDFDAIRAEMGLTREDGPVWEAMQRMSPATQALGCSRSGSVGESVHSAGTRTFRVE